jgi:hypothetical protein
MLNFLKNFCNKIAKHVLSLLPLTFKYLHYKQLMEMLCLKHYALFAEER